MRGNKQLWMSITSQIVRKLEEENKKIKLTLKELPQEQLVAELTTKFESREDLVVYKKLLNVLIDNFTKEELKLLSKNSTTIAYRTDDLFDYILSIYDNQLSFTEQRVNMLLDELLLKKYNEMKISYNKNDIFDSVVINSSDVTGVDELIEKLVSEYIK
jgi:hypothetical protein